MVAAYSYMALVPIIQPPVIKAITTKKERQIRMPYEPKEVTKLTRILFPIVITVIAGLFAPSSVALVGFLMFGNLIRECGVLNSLSDTAQNVLANLITIFLGITIASQWKLPSSSASVRSSSSVSASSRSYSIRQAVFFSQNSSTSSPRRSLTP